MYDPHKNSDLSSEMELMGGKGRLIKVQLPDQPAPNVDWYWIKLGNCHACRHYRKHPPKCMSAKITDAQFFDEYMTANNCPEFRAGVNPATNNPDLLDVMRAAGLATGTPSQKVIIIVDKPWSLSLAIRAHREQSIFLNMASQADSGVANDPKHGEYVDMTDDLEREEVAALSTDAVGHQHKGKGTGGGQFTSTGGGSAPNPSQNLPKGSGEDGAREKAKQDIKWKDGVTLIVGSNRANSSLPNETRPQLDDTERGALQNYSYQGDVPLHAKLRGQDYSWSQKTEEFIDELQNGLDSAFAKAPTMKTPVRVVRGMNPPQEVMEQFVKKFQQGQKTSAPVTIDDSYASTTRPGFLSELMDKMGLKDAVKKPFQGNIKLTIDACHGIDMMPFSKLTGESELLLPRGAQFDVVAVKQKGGTCHVHLKQRPPNAAPTPTASTPLAIRSDKPPLSGVEWRALVKFYQDNPDRLKRWMNDGATVKVATRQAPPPRP